MTDEQTTEHDEQEQEDQGRDEQEAQEGSGADDAEEARSSGDQGEDSGDSSGDDDGEKTDKEKQDEEIEQAKQEVKDLEDDPPQDLEDWPSGKAKYETFGGAEGDHGYHEGPEEALGPSSLRHHEDGSVSVEGEEVDDPDEHKGEPIPGGPTDPDTANLRSDKADPRTRRRTRARAAATRARTTTTRATPSPGRRRVRAPRARRAQLAAVDHPVAHRGAAAADRRGGPAAPCSST